MDNLLIRGMPKMKEKFMGVYLDRKNYKSIFAFNFLIPYFQTRFAPLPEKKHFPAGLT